MKRLLAVVVVMLAVTAICSAQLAFRGIGGAVGFASISFNGGTSSSESLSGFLIAAHADLGEFTKDFVFFPDVEYFSASKDINGGTWKVSDFAINANVHYNIAMEGMLKPYVGAGLGYNSLSTTATITDPFFGTFSATASDSRIGINLLAGINYKLNDMLTLVVEPRYVLASDFNHFIVKAGITYAMK
jgi:opacity protein-like surface antigen